MVVVRDGRDTDVVPEEVVRGDVVRVRPGDQVVVDGPVLDGAVEVDESLLTGESEALRRPPGEDLLSGSHCVGGAGLQLARDVGAASYANRLTAEARRDSTDITPLQRRIAFVIRLTMVLVVLMGGAILLQAALEGFTLLRVVQTTAVLSGLVPYGLFFLIALAYTTGAVASSRRGALVQRVNAVESVSNVDVVCTDKTGTLTTGQPHPGVGDAGRCRRRGDGDGGAGVDGPQHRRTQPHDGGAGRRTSPGSRCRCGTRSPFSSALRWSALQTDDATWVLGAPEALAPALRGPDLTAEVRARTAQGLRVLLFARADRSRRARCAGRTARRACPRSNRWPWSRWPTSCGPTSPRPSPGSVRRASRSRCSPATTRTPSPRSPPARASRTRRPVHAGNLHELSDAELDAVVGRGVVFGRVAPEQKERIVLSLRRQGRYVAMVGDGVNDARALKAAQVGVAMRSGSAVTRDVADIVLTDDSLAALVPARRQGRRIIAGISMSAQVFLARVATQALVIVAVTMLGLGFPYSPAQGGLTLFTVGVPDALPDRLGAARTARPAPAGHDRPLRPARGRPHRRRRGRRLRGPLHAGRRRVHRRRRARPSSSPSSSGTPA